MEYRNLEIDFIRRTLTVINQYREFLNQNSNADSFDVTIYINSLIGLIILPDEKGFLKKFLPNDRIEDWGLKRERIKDSEINTIKELSIKLRNSVAHFDIEFGSNDEKTIDKVFFKDSLNKKGIIAEFDIDDFKIFVELLADTLLKNAEKYKNKSINH
jgi:hypothetical protein